jgi:malate dehydrogenase (quinone)
MQDNQYYTQVAIVGSGISGSALLFMLSRYTSIRSLALFEKYDKPAMLNSTAKANSQTLHLGDIESNYDLEKARKFKASSSMVANFISHFGYEEILGFRKTKMLIAVGEEEIARLKERYEAFKSLYPLLELWDKKDLEELEPILLEGRKEDICAMGVKDSISTVDYGKLAKTFIDLSSAKDKDISLHFDTDVTNITRKWGKFVLHTNQGEFMAESVIVNAGAHSLLLAHEMGYGKEYAMLPIGGSFFFANKALLSSKVYTMQNPKLPFAAVHGDPDLTAKWHTRFGPTAFALPKLERYHDMEIGKLLELLNIDMSVLSVYKDLMCDDEIRAYILRNFAHELPAVGKDFFIKEAQKIIPTLCAEDIHYAKGYGGMRPQIIDKTHKTLLLGEAKIDTKEGIVFNMTPSPGASSCLGNAYADAQILCSYLKENIHTRKLQAELF